MIAKTRAIVLRNTNYSENSVISKMYTREFGLRTYILQSIRKGKAAIRPSMIQPLSIVEMDVYEKSSSNINRVKELKNTPLLINIQDSMIKKSVALFLVEILNHCITEEQCEEELFDFLESQILNLEKLDPNSLFPITFLLSLSKYLGVEPQGHFSDQTSYFSIDEGIFKSEVGLNTSSTEVARLIDLVLNNSLKDAQKVHSVVRKETLNELMKYYQFHITKNKRIKSVEILSELLS
ncbi:DNA repair protein RecO [Bacteroidia bacterium]|nr:DNA repair protein RecO [Bacteroidia bacterium]MDB9881732.1 DNA repair protein RecO [Bacteroidia bacterium]